jgi:hypothetical protein
LAAVYAVPLIGCAAAQAVPLIGMMTHLAIGDTWNYINNTQKKCAGVARVMRTTFVHFPRLRICSGQTLLILLI